MLGGSRIDLTSGSLTATGNPLDLAIAGNGFFVVQSAQGVAYTRNGGFHATPAGQLVTAEGDAVLGEQGPITLPKARSRSAPMERFRWTARWWRSFVLRSSRRTQASARSVTRLYAAPGRFRVARGVVFDPPGNARRSNVSPVEGVVQLITVQRNAEMMQRALTLFDSQFNQTAVQDLPRV